MIEALFGNKSIEKILLFLFVNRKCYGTQLHKWLSSPLTPLQKALQRLERSGIITSFYEGKTRVYQFNPTYPLLTELELLLKKAYTNIALADQREYYILKESSKIHEKTPTLLSFWQLLKKTSQLSFQATTNSLIQNGWQGQGKAEVVVTTQDDKTLLFHEKGVWINSEGVQITFSNVFRWVLDCTKAIISLEHLRRGIDHPTFLFYLTPKTKNSLVSLESHLCKKDSYFGQIHFEENSFQFHWRVIGPKKNEEINYHYM